MSTQPLGSPYFQAFDANGNPLSGGLLYTYAAGTTTPLSTYTDSTGAVPNANPVVLDSTGAAQVWMQAGVLYKFVLKDSGGALIRTTDNYPSPSQQSVNTDVAATEPGGRLTLTAGTPLTTGDVTGATTIYYVPYRHDKVPLYDGTNWTLYSVGSQLAQTTVDNTKSPAAVVANTCYDLFVWNDSGTVRLSRGPAWASDTSRGSGIGSTALTQINGRWVNGYSIANGPAAQLGLYVGTVRSDGSAQINDSFAKRHVWNCHNRRSRPLRVQETAASWNYNGVTWRQANANAANQLAFVVGLSEDAIPVRVVGCAFNSTSANYVSVGVGVDSTTAPATGQIAGATAGYSGLLSYATPTASWVGFPGIGYHYLAWLEIASAAGTTTWYGTGGAGNGYAGGISGDFLA